MNHSEVLEALEAIIERWMMTEERQGRAVTKETLDPMIPTWVGYLFQRGFSEHEAQVMVLACQLCAVGKLAFKAREMENSRRTWDTFKQVSAN